jgi:chitinase
LSKAGKARRALGRLSRTKRRIVAIAAALTLLPLAGTLALAPTSQAQSDPVTLGYFTEWGVYDRDYHVKDLVESGSADQITHINYAFGNVQNGECTMGDSYAAYDRFYSAEESVSGEADSWDTGALRGNFNQLRQLKEQYPDIEVLWSFGGWSWSQRLQGGRAERAALRPVLL